VQVLRLKFVKKFIKLIKITNCVCGRICKSCDVAEVRAECICVARICKSCDVAVVRGPQ
jgi:hypothetical protein